MNFVGHLGVIAAASIAGASSPVLIHKEPARMPPDACFGFTGICSATVAFTVLPDGSVADPAIRDSSHSRLCDLAVKHAVAKWRYAPGNRAVDVVDQVYGYTCPASAANSSVQQTIARYAGSRR